MSIDLTDERTALIAIASIAPPADSLTRRFIDQYGAAGALRIAAGDSPPPTITDLGFQSWRKMVAPALDTDRVHGILTGGQELGLVVLCPTDQHWPDGLRDLRGRAPLVLWAKGELSHLDASIHSRITIVGARAATSYGEHLTTDLVQDLARSGTQIVSGGAYGIDAAAHRAALTIGGTTIAIMAGGLDRYYPAGNQGLIQQVADIGLVISEAAPGVAPTRHRFEARNRLLAAFSGTTVIVEAGARSGTCLVAEEASVLERSVAALPGPVTSAASAGCHRLIQDGTARLVQNAGDIRRLTEAPIDGTESDRSASLRRDALPGLGQFGFTRPSMQSRSQSPRR